LAAKVTDPRPRPQYGEYATPEEQAKAMGVLSPPPISDEDAAAAASGVAKAPAFGEGVAPARPVATTPVSLDKPGDVVPAVPAGSHAVTALGAARPRRMWDQVFSAALLTFGLISVLGSIQRYGDFGATLKTTVAQMGYGDYTSTGLASSIGIAINVSQIVLWVVTAFITLRLLQKNRLSFYVPLIGGAVATIVIVVLVGVALLSDPSITAKLFPGA
jgi:hypothetical protein